MQFTTISGELRKMKNKLSDVIYEYFRKLDKSLLVFAVIASAVSILLLYSLCINGTVAPRYYQIQFISSAMGIVFCFIMSAMDYKKIAKNYTIEEIDSFFMYNSKYNSLHNTEEE